MLDYKKAAEIATNEAKGSYLEGLPIGGVLDIGDRWAVVFDLSSILSQYEVTPPGFCDTIGVDKETGKTGYITIPPIENIELLDTGKVVYEREHFLETDEK